MKYDFSGKTVLISGGSSGIGKAMCCEFAKNGANIAFLYDSNDSGAEETFQEVKDTGVECFKYKASVEDFGQVKKAVDDLVSKTGRIDVVINNSGILKVGPLAGMHYDEWKNIIDTNVNGCFRLTKCSFPYLLKSKGTVINISSYMAFRPSGMGQAVYSASKAAIIGFTRELANEAGKIGIRVNAIAPGLIDTKMIAKLPEKTLKDLLKGNSIKHVGEVSDISEMACYLASDSAKYINGQTFVVDGGGVKGMF